MGPKAEPQINETLLHIKRYNFELIKKFAIKIFMPYFFLTENRYLDFFSSPSAFLLPSSKLISKVTNNISKIYFQRKKEQQEPSDLYKGIQLPLHMIIFWTATQLGKKILFFFFPRRAVFIVCSVF